MSISPSLVKPDTASHPPTTRGERSSFSALNQYLRPMRLTLLAWFKTRSKGGMRSFSDFDWSETYRMTSKHQSIHPTFQCLGKILLADARDLHRRNQLQKTLHASPPCMTCSRGLWIYASPSLQKEWANTVNQLHARHQFVAGGKHFLRITSGIGPAKRHTYRLRNHNRPSRTSLLEYFGWCLSAKEWQ